MFKNGDVDNLQDATNCNTFLFTNNFMTVYIYYYFPILNISFQGEKVYIEEETEDLVTVMTRFG